MEAAVGPALTKGAATSIGSGLPSLSHDFDAGAGGDEVVEVDDVGIFQADAAGAGGSADEVFAVGAVDVDVAVPTGAVVGLFTVEPEDAGEDEIFFFHRVG